MASASCTWPRAPAWWSSAFRAYWATPWLKRIANSGPRQALLPEAPKIVGMLSKQDNDLLCRTNAGTPMGELFRRFWMPALVPGELPHADCDPIRFRILGEDLIAFRDTNGRSAFIQNNCPHRGASLFFGRNEEAGLRCVYHGWKFDVDGNCVD